MKKRVLNLLVIFIVSIPLCLWELFPPSTLAAWTAVPTRHFFTVDGNYVFAEIYNIEGNNYFKLRDMAMLLKDTDAHFSVEYDSPSKTILVGTGIDYEPVGGELAVGEDKSGTCVPARHTLKVNGRTVDVQAYNIGGNNFYKLRDLGRLLNFYVAYDSDSDTAMVVSAYYIRHTDVYNPTQNVTVYYEVPVFRGNTPGLRKINQELQALERGFGEELAGVRTTIDTPSPQDNLHDIRTATVDSFSDRLVSVTLTFEEQLGGIGDEGANGYVFDAETGGRLFLQDVLGGSDEYVRNAVISALEEQYPRLASNGGAFDSKSILRSMNLLDLDFTVKDGRAIVYFDKYEIAAGAEGSFQVTLSNPLLFY